MLGSTYPRYGASRSQPASLNTLIDVLYGLLRSVIVYMSFHWLVAAEPVMLADDDITTCSAVPTFENRYSLECIAPPPPRQELEQVRNQLRYCCSRCWLPAARARRSTLNGPRGPCSLARARPMMIRTLAPRRCAARRWFTNTQLLKFQVIARVLPLRGGWSMARSTLELISWSPGWLKETPCFGRNLSLRAPGASRASRSAA